MKAYIRSAIPFLIILLIVLACGNTKNKDTSNTTKKEETVNTQKEKELTTRDYEKNLDNETSKKKKKKKNESYTDKTSPKVETYKPRYRIGARCCDGTRSYATGRGACSHHGGVCEWLYSN